MAACFPLQFLNVAFHGVSGRLFANDREHLRLRHSGLKLRKSLVHLTADAQQRDNWDE